jgi:hypothetical protein
VLAIDESVNMLLSGKRVGWGAPTYKSLGEDWRELTDVLAPLSASKSEQEHRLEIVTGGVVEMWSLDSPDNIRGRKYHRFIFNECASVPKLREIFSKIVRPCLIDYVGDARFYGTPAGRNDYHTLYTMGLDDSSQEWKSFHYTSYDNPYIAPSELEASQATMTEREYRQEILAQFLDNEGVVFRNLDGCLHSTPGGIWDEHKNHGIVAGIDWGKNNDFTAVSIGCSDCRRELVLDRFNQIDYAFQRMRIQTIFHKWHVGRAIAEQNSIGTPILEQMQREGIKVVGFTTTYQSKIALIEMLSLELEKGEIQFLPDEVGKAELEAYEMKTNPKTGMTSYNAPEGMHDDTVIARALMVRAMGNGPVRTVNKEVYERQRKALQLLRRL